MSAGEDTFEFHCRAHGLQPVREFRFCPTRRWRFDFAFPDQMIAVEIEGGTWIKSRHTTGKGYQTDCEKYSEAAVLGWRVIRVTTSMVESGKAIEYALRALSMCDPAKRGFPSSHQA